MQDTRSQELYFSHPVLYHARQEKDDDEERKAARPLSGHSTRPTGMGR
jgi:hypothetical protein